MGATFFYFAALEGWASRNCDQRHKVLSICCHGSRCCKSEVVDECQRHSGEEAAAARFPLRQKTGQVFAASSGTVQGQSKSNKHFFHPS